MGLALWACVGCGSELPPPPEPSTVGFQVEPEAPLDAVSPVVRLRVGGDRANPATLRVFRDTLSDYHAARIRSGELPNTLLEREVPTLAWFEADGARVAPVEALADGVYSLASAELGALGTFSVRADAAPVVYRRLWPPLEAVGLGAAYCGAPAELAPAEIVLAPSGAPARLLPGLGSESLFSDRCLRLEPVDEVPEGLALVPPLGQPVLLDPAPLVVSGAVAAPPEAECAPPEIALGAGCALVEDDRLTLRGTQALLWLFAAPAPAAIEAPLGAPVSAGGLPPDSEVRVRGETVDVEGRAVAFDVTLHTLPAMARVVLNEVLANSNGPEPAMEWIEVLNAGSASINLEGYRLEDAGGSVTLPAVSLAPGAFALLVKEGFVADPSVDVAPLPGTVLVGLPSLGKNGLSNTGELLRLFDSTGALVSRVPAIAAKHAGISLARRAPDAPDDEGSFAEHAEPGASPGAPNVVGE